MDTFDYCAVCEEYNGHRFSCATLNLNGKTIAINQENCDMTSMATNAIVKTSKTATELNKTGMSARKIVNEAFKRKPNIDQYYRGNAMANAFWKACQS
jgi:hypothetical protein